jgi:hypothetical protein
MARGTAFCLNLTSQLSDSVLRTLHHRQWGCAKRRRLRAAVLPPVGEYCDD